MMVESMKKTPVLCIVGPTASGKTSLALRLSHALGGEIVNMDSMQIYRGMDIGTAKPTMAERENIPHHLMDIIEPTETFTVAQYARLAEATLHSIHARGVLPILVGGTGFYLRALTDGLSLGGVPSDPALRDALKQMALEPGGKRKLHERLRACDAVTADRLHENDVQRVARAIEVFELTGVPTSAQRREMPDQPFLFCMLGTTLERKMLYQRTDERVDTMVTKGLLSEVRTLLSHGVPPQAQAMQGIGYKEMVPVVCKDVSLNDAVIAMKQNTRHYAKRQWTWFRAEEQVQWLDMAQAESMDEALRIGETFREETKP